MMIAVPQESEIILRCAVDPQRSGSVRAIREILVDVLTSYQITGQVERETSPCPSERQTTAA